MDQFDSSIELETFLKFYNYMNLFDNVLQS